MQKYIIDKIFEQKIQKDKILGEIIDYLLSRDYKNFLENIVKIKNTKDQNILNAIYSLFVQDFKTSEDLLKSLLNDKEYRDYALLVFAFLNNERHAYSQTIAAFEKYLKNNPNELEVEVFICELLIKKKEEKLSLIRLLKILSSNRQSIEITVNLIKYFLYLKDGVNALNAFYKIFVLSVPDLENSSTLLGAFVKAGAYKISFEQLEVLYERFGQDDKLKINFANFLYEKKKYEKALSILDEIIKNENSVHLLMESYAKKALIYSEINESKKTKNLLEYIKKLECEDHKVYLIIAYAYSNICEYEEGIKYCKKSLDIKQEANTYSLLGQCYYKSNQFEKAKASNYKGLELEPYNISLHWNQSLVYLSEGDLEKGFFHYDLRIAPGNNFKTKLPLVNVNLYNGVDLKEKSIFVYDEQGNGDTLAFIRMLPLLKEKTKEVVFYCRKELFPLFQNNKEFFKDVIFLDNNEKIPNKFNFDYQIPLMSLSSRLNITKESIPFTNGYLKASKSMLDKWEKILSNICSRKLKIAFTWSGNPNFGFDNYRSIPTKLIKPLIEAHQDIDFFAVTKGRVDESLENEFKNIPIIRVAPYLDSFDDTAALLEFCDLVISVDTAVAHLSLALGKETWVLLYHFPFWVWGQKDKSIWYENSKIYKQEKALQWENVLDKVSEDLNIFKKDRT